jgi:hypothetical protein
MAGQPTQNKFLGYRVRSAAVIALTDAKGVPLSLAELARAVEAMGIPLGPRPNETLSDALRWEVWRGRVQRWGRGTYKAGHEIPRSTLLYMRGRVAAYANGDVTPARRRHSENVITSEL